MSKDQDLRKLWSGAPKPQAQIPQIDEEGYKAFDTREGCADLHLHCATAPSQFPAYTYLLNVVYDHDHQSVITLVYSFMVVEIEGENLAPIVHALSFRNCERIHEYHAKLYPKKPSAGDPIVTSIKILANAYDKSAAG